jgi:predicted dehydrogenase
MAETLKAVVIGAGILGSQYAELLHAHAGVTLAAVADLRIETAEHVASASGARAYADYGDMLRVERPDLVIVATPDPLHREPVLTALECGAPYIIQEKPLATTHEDAEAICEAVERHRARLFVNYANRAAPLDMATHYVLQHGLLGEPVYGESRLDDHISVPTRLWGARTRDWAAGSSPAHFLLSHVVDLLRWYMAPAEVTEVYAVTRRRVLLNTPDLYDAFLTFDSGLVVRVKAEWIKHMDELVEFYSCFSGAEGTLIYNKLGGFGTEAGWRANIAGRVTPDEIRAHQAELLSRGINVSVLLHRTAPGANTLTAADAEPRTALEYRGACGGRALALVEHCLAAIAEDTLQPTSWRGWGPLPTHLDGLTQTRIVAAIVQSAESEQPVLL